MEFINEFSQYPFAVYAARIILAGVCGFAIGLERSLNQKSAGVRTHAIVCCASALFMIVSIYGFKDADGLMGDRGADPSRIAAQVVTGISFLGAGMIFRDKEGDAIRGLTTAAGIWSTAAIGLAAGAGMYLLAVFVTAFLILFMVIMHRFPLGGDSTADYRLSITAKSEEDFYPVILENLNKNNAQISKLKITKSPDGSVTYKLTLKVNEVPEAEDLSRFMNDHSEVSDISGNVV